MKETTKIDDFIFELWDQKKLSYAEIAKIQMPSNLSLSRIRNIVYSGGKDSSLIETNIYRLFRLKFLELKDINAAIVQVYENQPRVFISEISVRRAVNRKLKRLAGVPVR